MRVAGNNNALIQGSLMQGKFSSSQLYKNIKDRDVNIENTSSNKSSNKPMSVYDKMIEKIKEQMKRVQENENYDDDTKKSKLKDLKSQIEDIRKAEQEEKMKKLEGKTKDDTEDDKSKPIENNDGDELMLSDEMKEILKNELNLDKKEIKNAMRKELKGSSDILKSEIEADKSRGLNTEKKEDQLINLRRKIRALDENALDKMANAEVNVNTNSDKTANKTVKVADDKKVMEERLEEQEKITQEVKKAEEEKRAKENLVK